MTSRYTLRVKKPFCAAHRLDGYDGPCARDHGHNYCAEIEVQATQLDRIGLAMDSYTIKQAANEVIDSLDHQHLNTLPQFADENPSAEVIAKWIYQQMARSINNEHVTVSAITLWETDKFSVRYEEYA